MDTSPGPSPSNTVQPSSERSRSERLLPFFFAALETCWVDAILIALASIHFFPLHGLLFPFWAPLLLMAGSYWLTMRQTSASPLHRAGTSAAKARSSSLFIALACAILFIIWSTIYSPTLSFFNPRWFLLMLNSLLLLTLDAYHIIAIVLLAIYFCWRGLRIADDSIEPGSVSRVMLLGLGIFIAISLLQTVVSVAHFYILQTLVLIPLFFTLALCTRALAHLSLLRQTYRRGQQFDIRAQETSLFIVLGTLCVFLILATFLLALIANPAFLALLLHALAPIGQAYDWLTYALAYVLAFLLAPVFSLLAGLYAQQRTTKTKTPSIPANLGPTKSSAISPVITSVESVLKFALPLSLIALFTYLIWLYLRKHQLRRTHLDSPAEDTHESLWSQDLFWAQWKAFWFTLWRRIFRRTATQRSQTIDRASDMAIPLLARSIREIYQAFLKWSANRGYARKTYETPYEFEQRLDEYLAHVKPELHTITEVYATIRYGDILPDEAEVSRMQQNWQALQQKAQHDPT